MACCWKRSRVHLKEFHPPLKNNKNLPCSQTHKIIIIAQQNTLLHWFTFLNHLQSCLVELMLNSPYFFKLMLKSPSYNQKAKWWYCTQAQIVVATFCNSSGHTAFFFFFFF
mmetsp:Transcript_1703/g.2946  ORF Transcript_1703/g.2946 Transcript_1703/m.2946 type:complete len:111 (+) Transcript_1703:49-381(+)